MKTIVVASNNEHKIKEIKEIIKNVKILTLKDINYFDDIEETGNTFLENALIKAKTVSEFLKEKGLEYDVLSDDSGLCCEALNLAPGIYSARYAGDHDIVKNRKKLIKELNGKDKRAFFNCVIVLYHINGDYIYKDGKTYGKIIEEERGDTSFGYDPIFYSDELNKTFGEATSDEKNSVSHRKRALEQIIDVL